MKERPVIFNGEMVRAILDGRKTQTRRVMKDQPEPSKTRAGDFWFPSKKLESMVHVSDFTPGNSPIADSHLFFQEHCCPFGQVGDRLIPAMYIPSLDRRYCADVFGDIWSRANSGGEWRRLSGSANSKGYLTVTPASNGKYKTRSVHDLVSEAFLGERPKGMQIRHLDGFQRNNAPENLDYGTQEQNWSDRLVNGLSLGEDHHNSKLTTEIVNDIRESRLTQRALSVKYGVSQSTIWSVRNAKTWNENPVANPPNMPRWASRITLEITAVRVERLNDISQEDSQAEGMELTGWVPSYSNPDNAGFDETFTPYDNFAMLWESIYGEESWSANPWVWVIEFKRVEVRDASK
ncbi:TPA: HNH endonuclease [Serratia marcescens]|nr:HNH endonuclease [Serratia marcescens]